MPSSAPEYKYISGQHPSVHSSYISRTALNSASYLLPHLTSLSSSTPSFALLDVGCGPGSITTDLALRFPSAQITGVEHASSASALDVARAHASSLGVSNISFTTADVHSLTEKFPQGSFDVVHAHQVLQHCGNPTHALEQMRAVLKPGGFVAVRTADMGVLSCYPVDHPGPTRWAKLFGELGERNGGDMRAGASQHVWAGRAGFEGGKMVRTVGTQAWVTREEVRAAAETNAERVLESGMFGLAVEAGLAGREELEELAELWREWGEVEGAWMGFLNAEMVCFT